MFLLAASTNSSSAAWVVVAALAGLVVFLVGFYGSQKPKPVGFEFGFYPALFLGAGGAGATFFGLFQVFSTLQLI
ncbi:hypothetical protein [Streptomyces poriferorum]|uniref:Integral membrane protein n=1 Tax=Streptomyces poriferorum TaxID=2798799 RepID=A0ABY9J2Q0_9ACTN|nr:MULTISPECIES: hypothetical protein [unclassified Streptomyces]MDP5317410.1 hypothetical protein [Streptomyces sp. Alt4]WLQ53695.1 hypothetical protein P8A21_39800 [Streptomyces sp. Alt1]WLQ62016.1 hypothetical protein P8A19_41825 [Streptomyces sp. Alt2]